MVPLCFLPESAEKLPWLCPKCPHVAPLNDTRVVHAVDVALQKFNSGNNTNFYSLHEIGRGRIQVLPLIACVGRKHKG